MRADDTAGAANALNEAALLGRGEWLGFAASSELVSTCLAEVCCAASPGTLYTAETLLPRAMRQPDLPADCSAAPPPQGGLFCLLSRSAFLAAGGLEAAPTVQAMWMGFMEKLACFQNIQPWHKPRLFHGAWA